MHVKNKEQVEFSELMAEMEERGFKPAHVARRLGLSHSSVSQYLAGNSTPKPGTLELLRRVVREESGPGTVASSFRDQATPADLERARELMEKIKELGSQLSEIIDYRKPRKKKPAIYVHGSVGPRSDLERAEDGALRAASEDLKKPEA